MTTQLAAVAVGSNVGDRQGYLDLALALVDRTPNADVVATSRVYESAGWGREDLKPFLNAAFLVRITGMSPMDFLRELQGIEDALGRQRSLKWGPRTLDLDLLAIDDLVEESEHLSLPHPWISRRPFVYHPFDEIIGARESWRRLTVPHPDGLAIEGETEPLKIQPPAWGVQAPLSGPGEYDSSSEEDTLLLGKNLGQLLVGGEVIALDAPMGTGKSVLARGIARGLHIDGPIQSPSYTLCRRYETGRLILEHWDFYRLGSLDDLESTAFFDGMDAGTVRVIEWASSFPNAIAHPNLQVSLEQTGVETRRIIMEGGGGAPPPFAARVVLTTKGGVTT